MRTVANADKVVVLKDGQVHECGNPTELKNQGRLFAKMVKRQMLTE
jgi:ATP-binding cassette subfamily B protein